MRHTRLGFPSISRRLSSTAPNRALSSVLCLLVQLQQALKRLWASVLQQFDSQNWDLIQNQD